MWLHIFMRMLIGLLMRMSSVLFASLKPAGQGNLVYAPDYHQTRGRPKRRRIPSQGEKIPRKIRCGRCGTLTNHNKKTCRKGGEGR